MADGLIALRWFKNISIARKLYFAVGIMATLIGVELLVLLFSLSTLSSLRAYVGGEGLWSKAQKDAVFHLYSYGVSRADKDYELFEQFMRVPMGDAKARRALLEKDQDADEAWEGFLEGRNHPDDIGGMITLFTRFSNNYYIREAISIWGEAQGIAEQLFPIAARLRQEINSSHPSEASISELLTSIAKTNERLTVLEDGFSFTLGEGSRWLEGVVLKLLFATAITVEITGLLLGISVGRGIQRGLATIIQAAAKFSSGELNARAKVLSRDEIGVVAKSFNEMADAVQMRVKELDQINLDLTHEVRERIRAEEELRGALARLESTLYELEWQTAERLRAEEMLRHSMKMKALGQLTGGIAHDFNNLLGVIIGNVEFLLDAVKDSPAHVEMAEEILRSALSGSQMTRRLLAIGRKQLLQPQRVGLNALVASQVTMLRRLLGAHIEVKVVEAPDLWFTDADPSQIEEALLNLVVNARDAMPNGGSLTLHTHNVHIDMESAGAYQETKEGDYVALVIADTGTGMAPAVAERAIEPFFTTKPPSSGSGLGLSMAYGFAKQSGGHFSIESAMGIGTTVSLYLPRARDGALMASIAPTVPAHVPGGTETILLVDDNHALLGATRRNLAAWGYTVLPAASGPAALAILRSDTIVDLLFTDIVMPEGMTGHEVAAAARQIQPHLKVLLTTGYAAELTEHDGSHLLYKPYDKQDLARAVRGVLDGLVVVEAWNR